MSEKGNYFFQEEKDKDTFLEGVSKKVCCWFGARHQEIYWFSD